MKSQKLKYSQIIILLFLSAISEFAFAESVVHGAGEFKEHIHGAHRECPLPKKRKDIIDCALELHPSVIRSVLKIDASSKLEEQASQIPNPTLSTRYVRGDNNGEGISELEANLSFTLELGGKRASRREHAVARKEEAIASNDVVRSDVKILTILNMHRLRQLLEEKQILTEVISAFTRVIGQLKKLPRLSAEQEASLTLFEMALEETRVNESELFEEERKLEYYFHISTGYSIDEIRGYLPESPQSWPSITKQETKNLSPEVKKLESLVSIAHKELDKENAQAWPDLNIGPSFAIEKDGLVENKMIGFNIQLPIPLFHMNGGGKAYARSQMQRAQRNISLKIAEESHERLEQLRVYESAVNILQKSMKQDLIEKKHNQIEELYLRGVVSSSVFLDSLKQKRSYLKSRNNREITALSALWSIYKYDGKIFEEEI